MTTYFLLNALHKCLKAMLYTTSMQLQRTDFSLPAERTAAADMVAEITAVIERCQQTEEQHLLWPMMVYEPGLADLLQQEHRECAALAHNLSAVALTFYATPVEQVHAGEKLLAAFEAFALAVIPHLSREERLVTQALGRFYSEAELAELGRSLARDAAVPSSWLLAGLTASEMLQWMNATRETEPIDALEALLRPGNCSPKSGAHITGGAAKNAGGGMVSMALAGSRNCAGKCSRSSSAACSKLQHGQPI